MGKCRYLKGDLSYIRVMRYDTCRNFPGSRSYTCYTSQRSAWWMYYYDVWNNRNQWITNDWKMRIQPEKYHNICIVSQYRTWIYTASRIIFIFYLQSHILSAKFMDLREIKRIKGGSLLTKI